MLEGLSVAAFLVMVATWAIQPARARLSRVKSEAPAGGRKVIQGTAGD